MNTKMNKRVPMTPKMKEMLGKATDNSVDPEQVALFEATSMNTKPLDKKGSIFNQATCTLNFLQEMASFLNNGGSVPVHTLHQQGMELPVGKTIHSDVMPMGDGNYELRSLFYIPLTETDLLNKLDGGTIDEVSVGVRAKGLCCSSCGWDFMGPEATFMNFYDQTCGNDHVIGDNGVHVIMNNLDNWMEQSLVSRGAANKAKILARTKQALGAETYAQLAASGIAPELTTIFATVTQETPMDVTKLVGDLSDLKASVMVKDGELAASKTTIEALNAQIATLTAQVAAAQPDPEAAKNKALAVEASAFIRAEAGRLCTAAGEAKLSDDADLAALKASIEANRVKLAGMFPVGGAKPLNASADSATEHKPTSAFKTIR